MKLHALILSCTRDAELCAAAVARLVARGIPVTVAHDAADPMPAVPGATMVSTTYPRAGNLNGRDCIIGILDSLAALAPEGDAPDWLLKVDSDTLVLPAFLAALDAAPAATAVYGLTYPGREFSGAAYAVRPAALPELRRRALMLWPGLHYVEDLTLWRMIQAARLPVLRGPLDWWDNAADLAPANAAPLAIHFGWGRDGMDKVRFPDRAAQDAEIARRMVGYRLPLPVVA